MLTFVNPLHCENMRVVLTNFSYINCNRA